jgi:hypothetical protein
MTKISKTKWLAPLRETAKRTRKRSPTNSQTLEKIAKDYINNTENLILPQSQVFIPPSENLTQNKNKT